MSFKKILAFSMIFLSSLSLQASDVDVTGLCVPKYCCENDCWWTKYTQYLSVEFRLAYYRPEEKKVRRIYSDAFSNWQVEIDRRFYNNWQIWAGVDNSSQNGRSIGLRDKTHLRITSCTFGLKYLYSLFECTELYMGGGVNYAALRIKDHSHYVHEYTDRQRFGGILKLGALYEVTEHVYIDFFFDYLFQEFRFEHSESSPYVERNHLNMNGLKTGVGIGYQF